MLHTDTAGARSFPLCAALLLLVLAAYAPVFCADFIVWDDTLHLTTNPSFNPPSWQNIASYWRHPFFGLYIPVTYTAWMGVASLAWIPGQAGSAGQLNPYIFHAANVLLHLLAAMVVWRLLTRLTGRATAAAYAAAFFALHPLMVEPVAWVSGFRDILAGLLSLTALYAYVRAVEPPAATGGPGDMPEGGSPLQPVPPRYTWYAVATLAFAGALLAKPASIAVIPMALALDLLLLRFRARWKSAAALLLPWMLGAVAITLVTRSAQEPPPAADIPALWQRPLIAADALGFYLQKLLIPISLCAHYGRTPHGVLTTGALWKTVCIVLAATGLVVALGWRRRWLLTAAALFAAGLLPVLGLVPFSFQSFSTVADRYAYLAMLGPALAIAFVLARQAHPAWRAAVAALLLACAALTFRQASTWHSTESVFSHVLAVNPTSTLALVKLSRLRLDQRDFPAAEQLARRAVDLAPGDPRGWINLGSALEGFARPSDAEACYQRAIDLPASVDAAPAYSNLAGMRGEAGRYEEAERLYLRALELDPTLREARQGLALARAKRRGGG